MKCPSCKNTDLLFSDPTGVRTSYCPICQGVWMDKVVFDKYFGCTITHYKPAGSQPGIEGDRLTPEYGDDFSCWNKPRIQRNLLHDFFD